MVGRGPRSCASAVPNRRDTYRDLPGHCGGCRHDSAGRDLPVAVLAGYVGQQRGIAGRDLAGA